MRLREPLLVLLLLGVVSCSEVEEVARTQVTLRIEGDEALRESTTALRAALFVKRGDDWSARSEVRLEPPVLKFPVDIPVLPSRGSDESAEIDVVLEAYAGMTLSLRTHAVTRFKPGKHVLATATLARCELPQAMCPESDACHGVDCQVCRGLVCGPAGNAAVSGDGVIPPTAPLDDAGVETAKPSERDAASPPNGTTPDAAASDASVPRVPECPADHTCAISYPCVVTPDGYTCRGHMADWPMPDVVAAAKVKPDYQVKSRTVLDKTTQLEWQVGIPRMYDGCKQRARIGDVETELGEVCSRDEAKQYCEQLDHDGKGWRLPTMIELMSLYELSNSNDASIDRTKFADTELWSFITATTVANGMTPWTIEFLGDYAAPGRAVAGKVRCVRGGAVPRFATPADRYDVRDDVVRDRATTLVWQKGFSAMKLPISQAGEYCRALGFRVPTAKELMTLVDPTRENPAIDTRAFPATPSDKFFAFGGMDANGDQQIRTVSFQAGALDLWAASAHVRCVRNE